MILLPVADNDKRPYAKEVKDKILQSLDRQFGGWHPGGTTKGTWYGQKEVCLRVVVYVRPDQKELFLKVVRVIGKELGQKVMAAECLAGGAVLLDVEGA